MDAEDFSRRLNWEEYLDLHVCHSEELSFSSSWIFQLLQMCCDGQKCKTHPSQSPSVAALSPKSIRVVNSLAWAFACDNTRHHASAWRQVYACYRFLKDRVVPIDSRLTRAIVRAAILRRIGEESGVVPREKGVHNPSLIIPNTPIYDTKPGRHELLKELRRLKIQVLEFQQAWNREHAGSTGLESVASTAKPVPASLSKLVYGLVGKVEGEGVLKELDALLKWWSWLSRHRNGTTEAATAAVSLSGGIGLGTKVQSPNAASFDISPDMSTSNMCLVPQSVLVALPKLRSGRIKRRHAQSQSRGQTQVQRNGDHDHYPQHNDQAAQHHSFEKLRATYGPPPPVNPQPVAATVTPGSAEAQDDGEVAYERPQIATKANRNRKGEIQWKYYRTTVGVPASTYWAPSST